MKEEWELLKDHYRWLQDERIEAEEDEGNWFIPFEVEPDDLREITKK